MARRSNSDSHLHFLRYILEANNARHLYIIASPLNDMLGFINPLLFVQLMLVFSIQPKYADVARDALKKYNAPLWSVIIDGVQSGNYAYTDADRQRSYVDFNRFANAPNSLANVLHHEVDHLKHRDHNNDPTDIMSYRLTTDNSGNVVEDTRVWA